MGVRVMIKDVAPLGLKPLNRPILPYLEDDVPSSGFKLPTLFSREESREAAEVPVMSDQDQTLRVGDEADQAVRCAGACRIADAKNFKAEFDQEVQDSILNVLVKKKSERGHRPASVVRPRSSHGRVVRGRWPRQRQCP